MTHFASFTAAVQLHFGIVTDVGAFGRVSITFD